MRRLTKEKMMKATKVDRDRMYPVSPMEFDTGIKRVLEPEIGTVFRLQTHSVDKGFHGHCIGHEIVTSITKLGWGQSEPHIESCPLKGENQIISILVNEYGMNAPE
jgi:hypothetical protein